MFVERIFQISPAQMDNFHVGFIYMYIYGIALNEITCSFKIAIKKYLGHQILPPEV